MSIQVYNGCTSVLIGEERENLAAEITFDLTSFISDYGAGICTLLMQRPQDTAPYPVSDLTVNGSAAVWRPTDTDTDFSGRGQAQLVYTVGEVVAKSPIITVYSNLSLVGEGDPPDPYESWLETLTELAVETQQSAQDAAASAQAAEQAAAGIEGDAERAEAAAQAAQGSATSAQGYASTASTKATEASQSASAAASAASTATQKASDAAGSASSSSGSATAAAGSASSASASATAAGNAQTAAETAQGKAEDAQAAAESAAQSVEASAAQIQQNTADIADLFDTKAPVIINTASGEIASFSDGADGMPVTRMTVAINPVQEGSGDPSPENVRPISGWTGVEIWDDPKYGGTIEWNQLAQLVSSAWTKYRLSMAVDGTKIRLQPTSNNSVKKCYFNVPANHTVLIKGTFLAEGSNYGFSYGIYNGAGTNNYKERMFVSYNGEDIKLGGIMSTDNDHHDVCIAFATSATTENYATIENLQVFDLTAMFGSGNEPTTVEEFETMFPADYYEYNAGEETCVSAVNGLPYSKWDISWETEAGTVYGGSAVYNGDGTWTLTVIPGFIASYNGETLSNNYISSQAAPNTTPVVGSQVFDFGATPVTYTITTEELINTLLGKNNVWADTGEIAAIDYPADTKLYIDRKIAAAVAALS